MSTAKTIAGIVPGLMATSLLAHNVRALDFDVNPKKGKKKPNHIKRMVKLGVTNLTAIPLIGVTASQVNTLS